MITVPLTSEQDTKLSRRIGLPRERWGGFQHLIDRVQQGIRHRSSGTILEITRDDARKVIHYASPSYGHGTYQEQLRCIAPLVAQALGDEPDTGSLFGGDADV
jgi:hypothetical protein